jgi:hypothetical protein
MCHPILVKVTFHPDDRRQLPVVHRLLTQIARLVEINALSQVTREVVEAARKSLVIGVV